MWDKSKTTWAVGIAQLTHHSPRWGHWQKSLDLRSRDFCPHLEPRGEFKGLRPVLEGFVVTMHEGAWKQEVKSRGRYWSGRKGQSYALGLGYRRWKSRRPWGAPHGVNTWLEHYYPGLLLLLPRDLTYCSHKPECIVTTNPDTSVLITIITWHFQFRPVNVSILHLKDDYRARSESRFACYAHCYVTWWPLTTGIVASQGPSTTDAVLVTRYLTPFTSACLNSFLRFLPQ